MLESEMGEGKEFPAALQTVLATVVPEVRRIIFNGDNYSEAWHEEAERRGLLNLPTTLDALPHLVKDKNARLFERYGVLSRRELESRYDISLHRYFHTINIEGETSAEIGKTMVLPAAIRYLNEVLETARNAKELGVKASGVTRMAKELAGMVDELEEVLGGLVAQNAELGGDDVASKAVHMRENIIPAMNRVRAAVDRLEKVIPDDLRPIPGYRELLFVK
jgi:glutamine synthetase